VSPTAGVLGQALARWALVIMGRARWPERYRRDHPEAARVASAHGIRELEAGNLPLQYCNALLRDQGRVRKAKGLALNVTAEDDPRCIRLRGRDAIFMSVSVITTPGSCEPTTLRLVRNASENADGRPRPFIGFDFDHDEIPKNLHAGQGRTESLAPYTVGDSSSKSSLPQSQCEALVQEKINRCNLVIALVGK